MANRKILKIENEIKKTREKITEYQNKLKGLEMQKTEAENLEIVQMVRSLHMNRNVEVPEPAALGKVMVHGADILARGHAEQNAG